MPSDADAGVAIYLPSDVDQCNMRSPIRYVVANINRLLIVPCDQLSSRKIEMKW